MRKASTSDWLIMIFIAAAIGGGGVGSCDNTGGGGGDKPRPQTSAVCNEYFKGGC